MGMSAAHFGSRRGFDTSGHLIMQEQAMTIQILILTAIVAIVAAPMVSFTFSRYFLRRRHAFRSDMEEMSEHCNEIAEKAAIFRGRKRAA